MSDTKITKKDARKTAADVQEFWLDQGYLINAWVEAGPYENGICDFVVRSDMIDGMPHNHPALRAAAIPQG